MKNLALLSGLLSVFFLATAICNADVTVDSGGDARLVTEPSSDRDDNNGGNTATGALIGINTGGIDNFMIYDFSDLSAVAGQTVAGATVNINVATGFMNGNHGSAADIINLHEIALGNLGWDQGGGVIGGGENGTSDSGWVSFLNRVQHDGTGTETAQAWVDAGGADVANLLGALSTLGSRPGWVGDGMSAPATMSFSIDAATAQGWVDNGLGGIALSVTDDGDSRSRFNMQAQPQNNDSISATIDFSILGDANDDAIFDNQDIASFVLALTDAKLYAMMFPNVDTDIVLDMNGDGFFNNNDIVGFVAALTGG